MLDRPDPDAVDAGLLVRVRAGEDSAYGELWARHAGAARRVAARLVPRADVEDLVSEAFERTLAALRAGRGPESSFFPYLARALRGRAATLHASRAHVTLADDDADLDCPVQDDDPFRGQPARGRLVQAFQELPSRWQDALWMSVVEAEPPRRAAVVLGTSPNGVSALVIRARRRLRANFIDLSAAESRDPLCRFAIAAPSRHGEHIDACVHCEATLAGLAELDVTLNARGATLAAILAAALGRLGAPHRRLRELLSAAPAKAAVTAVAAVAVTTAGVSLGPHLLAPSVHSRVAAGPGDAGAAPPLTGRSADPQAGASTPLATATSGGPLRRTPPARPPSAEPTGTSAPSGAPTGTGAPRPTAPSPSPTTAPAPATSAGPPPPAAPTTVIVLVTTTPTAVPTEASSAAPTESSTGPPTDAPSHAPTETRTETRTSTDGPADPNGRKPRAHPQSRPPARR